MYSEQVIKQFPVRLGNKLHEELDRVSSETHINKSVLVRLSVEKMISELDKTGVSTKMNSLLGVNNV